MGQGEMGVAGECAIIAMLLKGRIHEVSSLTYEKEIVSIRQKRVYLYCLTR